MLSAYFPSSFKTAYNSLWYTERHQKKKKKNRDLSGREGKAGLLTLAKCLLLEVLPLTMYIHSCCFFPVKKEKEPAKQIFSSKLQPKL